MPEHHLDLPKEDIDAVLRTKRKAREPKACYPCHSRKVPSSGDRPVKCDRQLPCDSCVKRDHPDLCTYERPLKRRQLALKSEPTSGDEYSRSGSPTLYGQTAGQNAPSDRALTVVGDRVSMPKERWDAMCEELRSAQEALSTLQSNLNSMQATEGQDCDTPNDAPMEAEKRGIYAPSGQMGTVHLGSSSVLAYMVGLGSSKSSQEAAKTVLEENVLPKLGLDNETATYPFVDLWSTDANSNDVNRLCAALPDDQLCRDFFTFYRDVACTIYPVLYDTIQFESQMEMMLLHRARAGGISAPTTNEKPFGVSLTWLGLFFAVLASGSQSSNLPAKERELTSQVYICCAYQALRMTTFISHPQLEGIQTLLIICNVLAYNMNAGTAYVVLGMAVRMATALGLQADAPQFTAQETFARRRVWWALAWQDSHFSVSYDRPTPSAIAQPGIPYQHGSHPGNRSYPESMFQIISLTLEIIRSRIVRPGSTMSLAMILNYKDEVARIVAEAAPHLRDRQYCMTTIQHTERCALKLHCNYVISELCRPALRGTHSGHHREAASPKSPLGDETTIGALRQDCIRGLRRTITAYVELHGIIDNPTRSWVGIQRAVSAAFLLAMLDEARSDVNIHRLLRALERAISERLTQENSFWSIDAHSPAGAISSSGTGSSGNSVSDLEDSPQWAKSMTKSLKALGKLNNALAEPKGYSGRVVPHVPIHGSTNLVPSSEQNAGFSMAQAPANNNLMLGAGKDRVAPFTPDSSSSSEWNYGNIAERAGQFVQAPLWG